MKVKTKDLVASENALKELVNQPIPILFALRFSLLMDTISPIIYRFREQQSVLLKKYGTQKENSLEYFIPFEGGKFELYQKDIEPIEEFEINIDFESIKISELGSIIIKPVSINQLIKLGIVNEN